MAPKRREEEINRTCPRCNGRRVVTEMDDKGRNLNIECPTCHGRGAI